MKKRALIILHPGFEELEAVAPVDLLSRAEIEVIQASVLKNKSVMGRSGIMINAQVALDDVTNETFDAIILPGGPGILKIRNNTTICELFRNQYKAGKIIACICAAPLILLDAGLIPEIKYTAHPSTITELPTALTAKIVVDKNIITSPGAGASIDFSLALVRVLTSGDKAAEIAKSICYNANSH